MALPGGPLEICFSFDTTISMTSYVDQVKARLQDMVQRLKADIPCIRIALFAHGDYYFETYKNTSPYVTKKCDFTDDVAELCNFINGAEPTAGGDWNECYELVLNEAKKDLSWSAGTNKVFVLIGDAQPHDPNDEKYNLNKLDWKQELADLCKQGVRTYGVYCKTGKSGNADETFFKDFATRGDGSFLWMKDFHSIFDFLMAICYREHGVEALNMYETEVRARGIDKRNEVNDMFTSLKKNLSTSSTSLKTELNLRKKTVVPKTVNFSPKTALTPRKKTVTSKTATGKKQVTLHNRINKPKKVKVMKRTMQTRLQKALMVQTRSQTAFAHTKMVF